MSLVITLDQIEATWTLPTKLQERVSNLTEAIPLTTYHFMESIDTAPALTNNLTASN